MKTTKTLLALIAAAAIVACSKDDISCENMHGEYEMTRIIYSFGGETVAEASPSSEEWEYLLNWWWDFIEVRFCDGNEVWLKAIHHRSYGSFVIDAEHLFIFDEVSNPNDWTFKIKGQDRGFSIYYFPYFDYYTLDEDFNPIYESNEVIDIESLEKIDTFYGYDIYFSERSSDNLPSGYLYFKDNRSFICQRFQGNDFWYDSIGYVYTKK